MKRLWHATVLTGLVLIGAVGMSLIWLSWLLGALLVVFLAG
jgi:hypothetical protein